MEHALDIHSTFLLRRRHFTAGDGRGDAGEYYGLPSPVSRPSPTPSERPTPLRLSFYPSSERLQSRSLESFCKSLEEAYRAFSYTVTSILLRTPPSIHPLPLATLPSTRSRLCLFLPLVIYNGFSPSFSELQKPPRLPCKLVPSVLWLHNYAPDFAMLRASPGYGARPDCYTFFGSLK